MHLDINLIDIIEVLINLRPRLLVVRMYATSRIVIIQRDIDMKVNPFLHPLPQDPYIKAMQELVAPHHLVLDLLRILVLFHRPLLQFHKFTAIF